MEKLKLFMYEREPGKYTYSLSLPKNTIARNFIYRLIADDDKVLYDILKDETVGSCIDTDRPDCFIELEKK